MTAPTTPPTVHVWTWESDVRSERTALEVIVYDVRRLTCVCGYHTKWRRDAYLADRQARREHGCDGQLSIP